MKFVRKLSQTNASYCTASRLYLTRCKRIRLTCHGRGQLSVLQTSRNKSGEKSVGKRMKSNLFDKFDFIQQSLL